MKKIAVVTGGGSGMGLATAKALGRAGNTVVLVGRSADKLRRAEGDLSLLGVESECFPCDLADWEAVQALARFAAGLGEVKTVIHAAGMSPHMGDPEEIMAANALGTVHVNDAFYPVMAPGGCVIDTASMSAYLTPALVMPRRVYPLSRTDRARFMKKMMGRVDLFPKKVRAGVAYGVSKDFVIWLARNDAQRFGEKGVRVLSVTPGNFETPMGALEQEEAMTYVRHNAIKRLGNVDEIAALYAACADERMGYLTGTDILCDGGCVASGCGPFSR